MSFKYIAKPLAFALFTGSGSRFDRRVAFRSARERRPLGLPGDLSTAGFRRLRWRAQFHQKRRNYPVGPYRRQPTCIVTALPWQTQGSLTRARANLSCVCRRPQPANSNGRPVRGGEPSASSIPCSA
jgi:hypothetical protein